MIDHSNEITGRFEWLRGGLLLNAWWPVLAIVAWSVHAQVQARYLMGLLTASGIEGDPSIFDVLFLYRQDLLAFGVLLPLLSVAFYRWLSLRLAIGIIAVVVVALQCLMYVNLQSWGQVGNFLSWQGFVNALSFGFSNPEFIGEYITLRGIAKLVILLTISFLLLVSASRLKSRFYVRFGGVIGYAAVAVCVVLVGLGYASKMHAAPISASFAGNAVRALLSLDFATSANFMPEGNLDSQFDTLSKAAKTEFRGGNFGVHRGSNLLLFILETGSIEFLDTRKELPTFPVLALLRQKIFLANNHFSSFPASAESNLSILTGLYPPRAIYGTCLIDIPRTGHHLPGPVAALREMGYETALYAPFKSQVPADKLVFEGTGFARVVYGSEINGPGSADERTFAKLLSDVKVWASSKQRFAAAFLPQIGHGPWSPQLGSSIKQRGSHLVELQLNWLMKIVDVLRSENVLEDTVILITGDHGVRTMNEDDRVKVGMIDWYSLHVPLLLYAPKADLSTVDSSIPSSHVDVPVELAQLFGLPNLPSYQGLALDDPRRPNRRQFMMAGWYYGANGFRDSDSAAMYSEPLDAAYERADRMVDFRVSDLVRDPDARNRIRKTLDEMAELQDSWIAHRACKASIGRPAAANSPG